MSDWEGDEHRTYIFVWGIRLFSIASRKGFEYKMGARMISTLGVETVRLKPQEAKGQKTKKKKNASSK